MIVRRCVALVILLVPAIVRADAPGVYALTGGVVHTAAGAPVAGGTVVIRDGLIEAAGAHVAIPADATLVDVSGSHVYPGLIDAQTSLGFSTPKGGSERASEPAPDSLAMRTLKLTDDEVDARRATGVTTVVTAPAYGIFNGQSAIVNLGNGTVESRVVKSPAALQISFNPRPTWIWPDSLMGVIAHIRQTFLDARQHAAATEIYSRRPSGLERPQENPGLDALRPVVRGEMPVVFLADSELMMRRALDLGRELGVRPVLSGARQGYAMAGDLKNVPVLVSVKWPTAPADKDDREDQPLRVIRDRRLSPTTPAALAKSGVAFALVSGAGKSGDFLPGIRKAIENGLAPEEALRATTIAPARIFGVDRQLGTLERGKIANVVVSDKPLFEEDAKVVRLYVDGREIRLPAEEKKQAAGEPASVIDGTWALSIRAPEGNVSMQITLRSENGRLTGTFSGDRGSGDVRGGALDGSTFEFTIAASSQSEAEASDWVFRGTLDGDAMSGTVATTLGTFEFSGSRSK